MGSYRTGVRQAEALPDTAGYCRIPPDSLTPQESDVISHINQQGSIKAIFIYSSRGLVVYRGEIWWADLPEPVGSEPGYRRPVLIVQADSSSRTNISTVIVVILTSNARLAHAPGNVLLPKDTTGLNRDSVANVSKIATIDKTFLTERVGFIRESFQSEIDDGLRMILHL